MTLQGKSNRRRIGRAFSMIAAICLIVFMLSLVDWNAFWDVLSRLSPVDLVAVFAVYVFLNLFRSLRFITLLDRGELPLKIVFPIALYHNLLVRLLPFKLGEFSYIALMRSRLHVPVEEGVSSLFGSRMMELLMIVLIAAASLMVSGSVVPNQSGLVVLLVVGSIGTGVVGFYYAGSIIRTGIHIFGIENRGSVFHRVANKLYSLAEGLDKLNQPRLFSRALFWSCFTYSSSFSINAILLRSVGVHVSLPTLVVLVSLGMFATAFPFNISGFGAVELSWAFGLTTFASYSTGEATSIGLMLNGYQLICATVAGLVGYLIVTIYGSYVRLDSQAVNQKG